MNARLCGLKGISMSLRLLIYKKDVTALVLQGCCEDALALCKF